MSLETIFQIHMFPSRVEFEAESQTNLEHGSIFIGAIRLSQDRPNTNDPKEGSPTLIRHSRGRAVPDLCAVKRINETCLLDHNLVKTLLLLRVALDQVHQDQIGVRVRNYEAEL